MNIEGDTKISNRYNKLPTKKPVLWNPLEGDPPSTAEYPLIEHRFLETVHKKDKLKADLRLDYRHPLYADISVKRILAPRNPVEYFADPYIRKLLHPMPLKRLLDSLMERIESEKKRSNHLRLLVNRLREDEDDLIDLIHENIFTIDEYLESLKTLREKIVHTLHSADRMYRSLKKIYRRATQDNIYL